MIYDDRFFCDEPAKEQVGRILKDYLTTTLNREVTTAATPDYEPVDITLTSITPTDVRTCAIELKERSSSVPYEDEFINDKHFDNYRESGYTILWAAYYPNAGRLIVWDFDKAPKKDLGTFAITRHTVLHDGKIPQTRQGVSIKDAILDISLKKSTV